VYLVGVRIRQAELVLVRIGHLVAVEIPRSQGGSKLSLIWIRRQELEARIRRGRRLNVFEGRRRRRPRGYIRKYRNRLRAAHVLGGLVRNRALNEQRPRKDDE
jgi:hypothetical protein